MAEASTWKKSLYKLIEKHAPAAVSDVYAKFSGMPLGAHYEWKKKLFNVAQRHIPYLLIAEYGMTSDQPDAFAKAYQDPQDPTHAGIAVIRTNYQERRIKKFPCFDAYICAYGRVKGTRWNTYTQILCTTEGFYMFQEIPRFIGENDITFFGLAYPDISPQRIALRSDKELVITDRGEKVLKDEFAENFYRFLRDANQLAIDENKLYEAAMEEMEK